MYAVGLSGVGSTSGNCFVTERRERGRKGRKEGEGGEERRTKGEEGWEGEDTIAVSEKYNCLGHTSFLHG